MPLLILIFAVLTIQGSEKHGSFGLWGSEFFRILEQPRVSRKTQISIKTEINLYFSLDWQSKSKLHFQQTILFEKTNPISSKQIGQHPQQANLGKCEHWRFKQRSTVQHSD